MITITFLYGSEANQKFDEIFTTDGKRNFSIAVIDKYEILSTIIKQVEDKSMTEVSIIVLGTEKPSGKLASLVEGYNHQYIACGIEAEEPNPISELEKKATLFKAVAKYGCDELTL